MKNLLEKNNSCLLNHLLFTKFITLFKRHDI